MKFKENRSISFIIIALVYLLATAVGIAVYLLLPFPGSAFWLKILIADIVATVVTFLFSVIFSNASVYDPYWSVQPIVIVLALSVQYGVTLPWALLLIAICFWGSRLTANWAYTFHGLTHQDWRYTMLHEQTGKLYPLVNFFGIHLVPTLIVYACVLPAAFVFTQYCTLNIGCVVGFILCIGAVILHGAADIQMHKFRKRGSKGFIRTGLWKYSRHPNYLGEILMWWSVGLSAVCVMPDRWYLLLGALLNTCLFLFVSIPMADKRQSRKRGYELYKSETRMLFPLAK
ncbi:MAG: DUF1295 domain-containing protein [Clostridia bacterium]|nr:DUF1295 domain-containing protein [Clostridia bacterium]